MSKSSAQRKFEWGVKRMETLCAEVEAFESGKAYVVETRKEVYADDDVRYSFYARRRKPMPDHWPLLIGEVVHNFRSALEHAVYAAAGGRGKTQFPIFTDECEFEVKGRPMISSVKAPVRAIIESAQPFKTTLLPPHTDALAVLSDLSNADKHREIATTAAYLELPWISHDDDIGEMTDATAAIGAPLPPDKETEVMAFTLHGPKALDRDVYPDVLYEVRMSRIRFVKKSDGRNGRITDNVRLRTTLENVSRRVTVVLDSIETGRTLPIWLAPAV